MKCEKCPELVKSRSRIVEGHGSKTAPIIFVGICPGNHLLKGGADSTGIPFKGDRSGDLYEKLLKEIGYEREEVYTTNIVKCRPARPDDIRYNRLPNSKEISNCLPYLIKEINDIKPKVVIALGKMVYDALHGKVDIPVYKTYHPAYIARNNTAYDAWVMSVKNIIVKEFGKEKEKDKLEFWV